MPKFAGVLFDNDGTLVDTRELILASMDHACKEVLGKTLPEEKLMAKVGQPLVVQVLDFTDDPDTQQRWLAVYREHNHKHHDAAIRPFPGIKECLEVLSDAGMKLGVVTSKLHDLAWHGLEICGLAPYISCCIGADDCEHPKPSSEPVILGLKSLGLRAQMCPYVGDSPFDMEAGFKAGCETLAVTWGMFSTETLKSENPTALLSTPEELIDYLL